MIRWFREQSQRLQVTLWTLIWPPTIWAGHFLFCYILAALWCEKAGGSLRTVQWSIGAATLLALLLILVAGAIAFHQMRLPGDDPPHEEGTREDRFRFIAMSTLMLAGLSFVAVVFTALPAVFFGVCQ